MYAGAKAAFYALSRSVTLKRLASKYGMRSRDSFARRFIAGETVEEAIEVSRDVQSQGLHLTLDYLGESVRTSEEAQAATREYVHLLDAIVASGIERNISLKLTQLGAGVDRATCVDNLRRILEPAGRHGFFVRIDMENSPWTQLTLDIVETLWQQEYRNIGIALQAALYRTEQDVRRMNQIGARVRLVKGAYKEPESVAYQKKSDVDQSFLRLMKVLLDSGVYPAVATHDPLMIAATRTYATERGLASDRFEFQMLYGIRRDLQASLVAEGYTMRLYIPFGREWFPYFMRRLGERPANLGFVVRGILVEK
ncbi:MAG TPA: proline dehydrogenase family protein [Vicinamibacterales bacterium]|jgi:proline dehydrogenase|nr:proline dehydrogenase family protein [Vicinamibacterales bacterium]